jgi:hypothetical protein
MSKHVRHQIFFTILPGKEKEFLGIKEQMIAQSLSLKGLLSSTSAKVLDQENTWVDTMIWETKEDALDSRNTFGSLPTAGQFLSLMAGPPVAEFMMEFAADKVLIKA